LGFLGIVLPDLCINLPDWLSGDCFPDVAMTGVARRAAAIEQCYFAKRKDSDKEYLKARGPLNVFIQFLMSKYIAISVT
jgi:hypothetical protein